MEIEVGEFPLSFEICDGCQCHEDEKIHGHFYVEGARLPTPVFSQEQAELLLKLIQKEGKISPDTIGRITEKAKTLPLKNGDESPDVFLLKILLDFSNIALERITNIVSNMVTELEGFGFPPVDDKNLN